MCIRPRCGFTRNPSRRQRIQRLLLPHRGILALRQQKIGIHIQPPLRHDARLHRAQRPRGSIARIHRRRQSLRLALLVHLLECLLRHHGLAAHFKFLRNSGFLQPLSRNAQRHAANCAHVRRHVFADLSIAARHSARQPRSAARRSFVVQRQAQPIQLQFRRVLHRQISRQLAHASIPVAQLLLGIGVVQAQHRPRVPHLLESLGRLPAHALRRRVRRQQLRMLRLESLQLIHQRVVLRIADRRRVHHVVEVLMPPQFRAQLLNALLRLRFAHLSHGQDYRMPRHVYPTSRSV